VHDVHGGAPRIADDKAKPWLADRVDTITGAAIVSKSHLREPVRTNAFFGAFGVARKVRARDTTRQQRRSGDLPGQRVLATAATEQRDVH
jgi:hypothetical protein